MIKKLKINQKAPEFSLEDQDGKTHALKNYREKWILLYFYPKDDTPGCTKEACAIRDNFPRFKNKKLAVLGVSVDPIKSHKKFAEKFRLPFPLLSDKKKEIVKKYGVWGKKTFMGRTYEGTRRMSFLINQEGKIAKIYEQVNPETHAKEVLNDYKRGVF